MYFSYYAPRQIKEKKTMAKKIVSIEIGVWWTKVLVMEDVKKNPTIYNAFYFDSPEHSVEDGFVRDKEVYLTALKAELAKRHILEKNVVFVLNCCSYSYSSRATAFGNFSV